MDTWLAFCTVFWFTTGCRVLRECEHPLTIHMYQWYVDLEDNNES